MKRLLVVSLLVLICGLPAQTQAQTPSSQDQALLALITSLLEQIEDLQAQLDEQLAQEQGEVAKDKEVDAKTNTASEWSHDRGEKELFASSEIQLDLLSDDYDVRTFLVRNDRLYEDYQWTKNTRSDGYRIWQIFADILTDEWVAENIRQYNTYRDPDGSLLGFVWQVRNDEPSWGLAMDVSRADFENPEWVRDMIVVLIHEAGHIVTLESEQANRKVTYASECTKQDGWFYGSGCALEDSYLAEFGNRFWNNTEVRFYNDLQDLEGDERTEAIDDFYEKYGDEFVTRYAVTSPLEDIAESFTNYILMAEPTGNTIAERKLRFFSEYPELVELRENMRERIEEYFVTEVE